MSLPLCICDFYAIEVHWFDQAELALGEAMLVVSYHLLSSLWLSIASRGYCFVICPSTEVRLTDH